MRTVLGILAGAGEVLLFAIGAGLLIAVAFKLL